MNKYPLIGASICAVVLLVLASLSNVVGYQTVQTSQQASFKERINQRELLFQTIVDIANNKEIQRIILKSQMGKGVFPVSDIPVLTKNQLNQMFFFGSLVSKNINSSMMQSIIGKYRFSNQVMQKELNDVIEKDVKVSGELSQLLNLSYQGKIIDWLSFIFGVIMSVILLSITLVSGILFVPTYVFNKIVDSIYTNHKDNIFILILWLFFQKWTMIWGEIFFFSFAFLLLLLAPYPPVPPKILHRLTN